MKLTSFKDASKPICYFNSLVQIEIPDSFSIKEIRGVWVANVLNIDLPTIEDLNLYFLKFREMLDTCVEFNINTIYFQVRTTNDAFYESNLNPYSRYFTGKEGKRPPIDVFRCILNEAKKKNIAIHAWCNPYRVSPDGKQSIEDYLKTCDSMNFAKLHPEYLVKDTSGKLILNPAREEVKQFIVDSMAELANRYEIDGIHFDDYFYPYSGLSEDLNDLADFEKRIDKNQSLGDFRRMHVSDVIKRVHEMLKRDYPKLRFGVSPFGIWKNQSSDPLGSNTAKACSESFSGQFADTYLWVKEKYIDYIVPQIYWEFGHPIAPFADICDWWVKLCEKSLVDLYIGHGSYRLGQTGEYENPDEVVNQLKYANQYDAVKGNIFFSYKSLLNENKEKPGIDKIKNLLSR